MFKLHWMRDILSCIYACNVWFSCIIFVIQLKLNWSEMLQIFSSDWYNLYLSSSELITKPSSQVQQLHQTATFRCCTNSPLSVSWSFGKTDIFFGNLILERMRSRYDILASTGSDGTKEADIIIHDLDMDHAGTYIMQRHGWARTGFSVGWTYSAGWIIPTHLYWMVHTVATQKFQAPESSPPVIAP